MQPYILIFITASNKREAKKISSALLDERLIACANIIDGVESHFWWKGRKEKTRECLIIAKSKKSCFNKIIKKVKSIHSYEVPEIIALPIIDGYKPYLEWIKKETRCDRRIL